MPSHLASITAGGRDFVPTHITVGGKLIFATGDDAVDLANGFRLNVLNHDKERRRQFEGLQSAIKGAVDPWGSADRPTPALAAAPVVHAPAAPVAASPAAKVSPPPVTSVSTVSESERRVVLEATRIVMAARADVAVGRAVNAIALCEGFRATGDQEASARYLATVKSFDAAIVSQAATLCWQHSPAIAAEFPTPESFAGYFNGLSAGTVRILSGQHSSARSSARREEFVTQADFDAYQRAEAHGGGVRIRGAFSNPPTGN